MSQPCEFGHYPSVFFVKECLCGGQAHTQLGWGSEWSSGGFFSRRSLGGEALCCGAVPGAADRGQQCLRSAGPAPSLPRCVRSSQWSIGASAQTKPAGLSYLLSFWSQAALIGSFAVDCEGLCFVLLFCLESGHFSYVLCWTQFPF